MNDWNISEWIKNIGSSVAKLIKQFPISWGDIKNKPTAFVLTDDKSAVKQINIETVAGTQMMITFDSEGQIVTSKEGDASGETNQSETH